MNLRNRIASWPHPYSASNYLPSPLKNAWRLSHFTTLATILPHLVDNRKASRSQHYNDPQKEDRSKPVRNMQSRPSTGPSNTSPHQRISIATYTYYSIQRKFLIATYTYFADQRKRPDPYQNNKGNALVSESLYQGVIIFSLKPAENQLPGSFSTQKLTAESSGPN